MRALALFLAICITLTASAQQVKFRLDDNSIIKDSAGTVYPAVIWKALLMKGFTLTPVDPTNERSEFLLVRLTEKQVAERFEKMPKPKESPFFKTGQLITLFKTRDINNNKVDLKNLDGRIAVINFWFINCPPCRMEIPDLNELVAKYKGNEKVVFVAVALDYAADLKDFLSRIPFNYTIIDNGKFIADNYRVKSFPTHLIVSPEGKVYYHSTGLGMNSIYWLKKSIDELLNEQGKTAAN